GRVHHFIGHIPRRFGLAPFFSVVEAHSCSLFSAEVRSHREGGRRCRWFRGRVAPGGHGRTPSATGRTTIWAYLFFVLSTSRRQASKELLSKLTGKVVS